jgi:hypothetical protein
MLDRSVGERLDRLEITRATYAGICGVNQGLFSLYLTGQAAPSPATEEKILSTLSELERLSRLLPFLPNLRGVRRVQGLLLMMQDGAFAPYERITAEVAALSEQSAPAVPQPFEPPTGDPQGYQTR